MATPVLDTCQYQYFGSSSLTCRNSIRRHHVPANALPPDAAFAPSRWENCIYVTHSRTENNPGWLLRVCFARHRRGRGSGGCRECHVAANWRCRQRGAGGTPALGDIGADRPSAGHRDKPLDSIKRVRPISHRRVVAGQLPATTFLTGCRKDHDGLTDNRLVLPLPRHVGPFGSDHPIPGSRSHTSHVRRG